MALSQTATRTAVPARAIRAARAGAASRSFHGLAISDVELRTGAAKGTLEGYGSIFGNVDSHGYVIERGAFVDTIAKGRLPAMLFSHHQDQIAGRWTSAYEDSTGLKLRGRLNLNTALGREIFELVKAGDLDGLSIGANIVKGGITFRDDVRVLTKLELLEVSLVSLPANDQARVSSIEATAVRSCREFEKFLRDAGFPRAAALKLASGGWRYLDPASHPSRSPDTALRRGLRDFIHQVQRKSSQIGALQ